MREYDAPEVTANNRLSRVQKSLARVSDKLPLLWDQAATALANGHDELARLALRRRRVVLGELESLSTLLGSGSPRGRVAERIQAADRLLDASLSEASLAVYPSRRPALALDFDPAVEADLHILRADLVEGSAQPAAREFEGEPRCQAQ